MDRATKAEEEIADTTADMIVADMIAAAAADHHAEATADVDRGATNCDCAVLMQLI